MIRAPLASTSYQHWLGFHVVEYSDADTGARVKKFGRTSEEANRRALAIINKARLKEKAPLIERWGPPFRIRARPSPIKPRLRFAFWTHHAVWIAIAGDHRAFGMNPADAWRQLTGKTAVGRSFTGM